MKNWPGLADILKKSFDELTVTRLILESPVGCDQH